MATIAGPNTGGGLFPDRKEVWLTFSAATTPGQVRYVRQSTIDATTGEMDVCTTPGASVATTACNTGIFVLALDTVAAGSKGRALLRGKGLARCYGVIALGDDLGVVTGANYLDQAVQTATSTVGTKIVAKTLAAKAGAATSALVSVYFDGWSGFGTVVVDTDT